MNQLIRDISELKYRAHNLDMHDTNKALNKAVRIACAELKRIKGSRKRLPWERGE